MEDINKDNVREYLLEKFGDINFIEESHQYFIDKNEYTPVSHIIKEYEVFVDWDLKAENYAKKYGRKKEDVQKEWKLNNLKSTISGTRIHEFGESYTNLLIGHPELICENNKRQYIEEYNTLIPICSKEESIKMFYDDLNDFDMFKLKPIGSEIKLSTKYIEGAQPICGTCDLLLYGEDALFSENDGFVLGDWKTNKSLYNDYNRRFKVKMKYPFNNLIDESFSHYIIQFNLYRRMLESVGVKIVDMVLIWLKDFGYEKIKVPMIENEIIDMIIMKKMS